MRTTMLLLAAMLGILTVTSKAPAQHDHGHAKDTKESAKASYLATDGYPLDTCIVSGKALPKEATIVTVEGRTYKTCSKDCAEKIQKDPANFAKKLDAARIAAQKPFYPLTTCVVSGKALDSMGGPREVIVDDRLVLLCCKGCEKKLADEKTAILKKLVDSAYESQKAAFKGKVCPVSGDEYPAVPVDVMHGYALIRLCCEDCLDKVKATPNAIVAKSAKPSQPAKAGADQGKKKGDDHGHGEHKHGEAEGPKK